MLNKPKFMSPSVNMYGNTVIDLNSETLPFSCIVDGSEAITDFQITVSKLKDNEIVLDTGVQTLEKPFLPINNRNQNVTFSIDLKKYLVKEINESGETQRKMYVALNTSPKYDESKTYYEYVEDKEGYLKYTYVRNEWENVRYSLYVEGFTNSSDAYYWDIHLQNSLTNNGASSAPEVFYANSVPETTIYYSYDNDFDNSAGLVKKGVTFQKRKVYFKAEYNQSEDVTIKRYGWRLTDATNDVVIMDTITQNQIYGVADDISCVCTGLINETKYLIELYIETQNGYSDVLQKIEFNVDYPVKNIDADFDIAALNDSAGIMLNWGNLRTTEGFVVGTNVGYVENFPIIHSDSVKIPEGSKIVFSDTANGKTLNIDENSYVVLSCQFNKTKDTTLLEMSGADNLSRTITRSLVYTAQDRKLKYTVTKGDEFAVWEQEISPKVSELCWHVITLPPLSDGAVECKLIESVAEGGAFPSEDLYPSDDLYPDFGTWDALRKEVG